MAWLSSQFSWTAINFWASPLSLAATNGISVDFFSCRYLDVSVPRVRLFTLWVQVKIPRYQIYLSSLSIERLVLKINLVAGWVAPFGNPGLYGRLSPHPGLSQTATSFIASYRQGIHLMRLLPWPYIANPDLWMSPSIKSFDAIYRFFRQHK